MFCIEAEANSNPVAWRVHTSLALTYDWIAIQVLVRAISNRLGCGSCHCAFAVAAAFGAHLQLAYDSQILRMRFSIHFMHHLRIQ